MLRQAFASPKLTTLMRRLKAPKYAAVGILESLWHFTGTQSPRGDIGRWSDEDIADAIGWDGDPAALVDALVRARWVDRCAAHRLVVHDWEDHCGQTVKRSQQVQSEGFASVVPAVASEQLAVASPAAELPAIEECVRDRQSDPDPDPAPAPAPEPAPAPARCALPLAAPEQPPEPAVSELEQLPAEAPTPEQARAAKDKLEADINRALNILADQPGGLEEKRLWLRAELRSCEAWCKEHGKPFRAGLLSWWKSYAAKPERPHRETARKERQRLAIVAEHKAMGLDTYAIQEPPEPSPELIEEFMRNNVLQFGSAS